MLKLTNEQSLAVERYCFLRLCSIDFDEARNAVKLIRRYSRDDIRHCALKTAILAYARPFSSNKGRLVPRHRLEPEIVPLEFRDLHEKVKGLRDQMVAHTDLPYRNPMIARWPKRGGGFQFPMSFRAGELCDIEKQLVRFGKMVEAVDRAISVRIIDAAGGLPTN